MNSVDFASMIPDSDRSSPVMKEISKAIISLSLSAATVITLGLSASAFTLEASDAYYTFRGNVIPIKPVGGV